MKTERKLYRMWRILSFALSVVLRVYGYKLMRKSAEQKEELGERIGKQFREMLFELEGPLIKIGQFLSIRADLLPGGFISQIQDLADQVPPSSWKKIKGVLEEEWDRPISDVLQSIEPKAVASASIGEVYRGKLPDGTDVAVKVQRPAIQSIVRTDFQSLAVIIWFARYFAPVPKGFINFSMLYQELKQVVERELDFHNEMNTSFHFQQRFRPLAWLRIPKVYGELTTSKVMVMEWIEAARVTDTSFLDKHGIDRMETARRLFRLFIPQWLEAGMFHADPHAGNVLIQSDGTLILLDFGMTGSISKTDAANFQRLVETLLLKDHKKAAEVLGDLGFLIPGTDTKVIEKPLAEALAFQINDLKNMDLFAVEKEVNQMVRSLPVQVPVRFVFLGRSFVTVEGMLHTLCPERESIDIMGPAFKEWLLESNLNKWKFIWKWINSQPAFRFFHLIQEVFQAPGQYMELKERLQRDEMVFTSFENQKKHAVTAGIAGLAGILGGTYIENFIILNAFYCLSGLGAVSYIYVSWKQKKWLSKTR
ncbi:ABC1 kinase family protein [Domibacillus indicus]|uniref:ABC1 kinase family protein n=1 Tax=Domibacillus indicus TaxID=1437523 RepID=UPI0009E6302F|nr:AarF/UbiB family protein [Domibacillus indicus]